MPHSYFVTHYFYQLSIFTLWTILVRAHLQGYIHRKAVHLKNIYVCQWEEE